MAKSIPSSGRARNAYIRLSRPENGRSDAWSVVGCAERAAHQSGMPEAFAVVREAAQAVSLWDRSLCGGLDVQVYLDWIRYLEARASGNTTT